MIALALLAAAVQENEGGAFGWRCYAPIEIDGYAGELWRDFGAKVANSPYVMQVHRDFDRSTHPVSAASDRPAPDARVRHDAYWTIDPRPLGPPDGRTSGFMRGRAAIDALRDGPDLVSIDFAWYTAIEGPVWAHYWGDGKYAGAELLMSARQIRRARDKTGRVGGFSAGLSNRALLAKLASARGWHVSAVDAAGRALFDESFPVPDRTLAEAEFRRWRERIDTLEVVFRATHDPLTQAGVTCADAANPASEI